MCVTWPLTVRTLKIHFAQVSLAGFFLNCCKCQCRQIRFHVHTVYTICLRLATSQTVRCVHDPITGHCIRPECLPWVSWLHFVFKVLEIRNVEFVALVCSHYSYICTVLWLTGFLWTFNKRSQLIQQYCPPPRTATTYLFFHPKEGRKLHATPNSLASWKFYDYSI